MNLYHNKSIENKTKFLYFFKHYQQISGYETILPLIIQFLAIYSNKNKTDGQ